MKNQIEVIMESKGIKRSEVPILTGLNRQQVSNCYLGIGAIPKKMIQFLEQIGEDTEKVQARYKEYQEQKRKALLKKIGA